MVIDSRESVRPVLSITCCWAQVAWRRKPPIAYRGDTNQTKREVKEKIETRSLILGLVGKDRKLPGSLGGTRICWSRRLGLEVSKGNGEQVDGEPVWGKERQIR